MLITTTPGIEGRTVTQYLGVVTAQGVLGVNAFKDVGAGVRNIFGGRSKSYENELASGVSDALAELEQQAAHLGADAVVGVDIDYETVGDKMLMVSASGHGGEAGLTGPGSTLLISCSQSVNLESHPQPPREPPESAVGSIPTLLGCATLQAWPGTAINPRSWMMDDRRWHLSA